LEHGIVAHSVAATCLGADASTTIDALAVELNDLALAFSAAERGDARAELRRDAARIIATLRHHVEASPATGAASRP
jgi:hypothetical protein